MKFEIKTYHNNISNKELLNDLCRVAEVNNKDTVTIREYQRLGTYGVNTFKRRFGSWINALDKAGLKIKPYHENISNSDLLFEIQRLWIELGRQPTTTDIRDGLSKYSLNTYRRRFGGWRETLNMFVSYATDAESNIIEKAQEPQNAHFSIPRESKKSTNSQKNRKREPNYRMRFMVLQRDHFKCCACGASPAKDPSVKLHVDHIVPWSKGGKTEFDNLQTLCSKCNLGKSDME